MARLVATGEVIPMAAAAADLLATGDIMITAARLEEVVVGEGVVHRLVTVVAEVVLLVVIQT